MSFSSRFGLDKALGMSTGCSPPAGVCFHSSRKNSGARVTRGAAPRWPWPCPRSCANALQAITTGTQESIPLGYRGVIYVAHPGAVVQAIDGTNGNLIWEYKRPSGMSRTKGLAVFEDLIFYTAPEGVLVALDARGQVRWEA